MSLAVLFHFLCAQHVSDINISIIRSSRTVLLNYHIGCCVLGSLCVGDLVRLGLRSVRVAGWGTTCASACNTDTTHTQPHQISNTQRTKNTTTDVVIQQQSRELLMMDILMSETCWAHKKWNKIANDIKLVFCSSTITMMHGYKLKWSRGIFPTSLVKDMGLLLRLCYTHYRSWPTVFRNKIVGLLAGMYKTLKEFLRCGIPVGR